MKKSILILFLFQVFVKSITLTAQTTKYSTWIELGETILMLIPSEIIINETQQAEVSVKFPDGSNLEFREKITGILEYKWKSGKTMSLKIDIKANGDYTYDLTNILGKIWSPKNIWSKIRNFGNQYQQLENEAQLQSVKNNTTSNRAVALRPNEIRNRNVNYFEEIDAPIIIQKKNQFRAIESTLSIPNKWDDVIDALMVLNSETIKSDYGCSTLTEFMKKLKKKKFHTIKRGNISEYDFNRIKEYYFTMIKCLTCRFDSCGQCKRLQGLDIPDIKKRTIKGRRKKKLRN